MDEPTPPMTSSPTIFVIDDNPSVRKSIARLIRSAGMQAETFASASEFLERVPGDQPGCLVLDVKMPGFDGMDLQEHLARRPYAPPIIFVTGHGDIPMSVQAIKKGAVDFLTKPFHDEDLLNAVRQALARDQRERRSYQELCDIRHLVDTLTPREDDVFRQILTGKLNKQIADALGIAEKTVKVHRGRVMEKLRVRSVAELVHLAEKLNLTGG